MAVWWLGRWVKISAVVAVVAVVAVKVYNNYPTGKLGVVFYYCTSSHSGRQQFAASSEGVSELPVSAESQLSVVIHGYTESSSREWVVNMTDALLRSEAGSVVVLVDYWDLVTISRPYMMVNVRRIADDVAALIDVLVVKKKVLLSRVHLVGFSLGGRIAGLAGDRVTQGLIGRITGIDASAPWLPPNTPSEFLDAGDAALVIQVRTSPISRLSPPGHIDFVVNGGTLQPGCDALYYPDTARQVCSHYRAVWIMVEAVERGGAVFPACQCDSWLSFEENTCACDVVNYLGRAALNTSAHGRFYLRTNATPPYSIPLTANNTTTTTTTTTNNNDD